MKVFLGGTCNGSRWRSNAIPVLNQNGLTFFDPVVSEWNEEAQAEERHQRNVCDICLYVITPKMKGVYAIAEAVDDSNKRPEKVVFFTMVEDYFHEFDRSQEHSLQQVGNMIERNGGVYLRSWDDFVSFFEEKGKETRAQLELFSRGIK